MGQNVRYCKAQELVSHLCPSHIIYVANCFTLYQHLHQEHRESKWKMDNLSVFFIIPIIVDIHGHRFEIYIIVLEIHENVDFVLGNKNNFELESVVNS